MSNEKEKLREEFDKLQEELLLHKYMYYVKSETLITDYEYDMLERKSKTMAKELGFRCDSWEGPEENEKHHIHWMIDFDEKHPLATKIIEKVAREKIRGKM